MPDAPPLRQSPTGPAWLDALLLAAPFALALVVGIVGLRYPSEWWAVKFLATLGALIVGLAVALPILLRRR